MGIDLRHLRCFIAVAEELHFRRAADRLGIAQPALSRTVQNLEAELGVTLFDRSNRNVQITKAGRTFLSGCYTILNGLEQTVADTQRVHMDKIGLLRIGYTDMAIAGRLPDVLRAFQSREPDIDLELRHAVTSEQLIQMEDGELDFGFVTGAIERVGYAYREVQSEQFVCVVHTDHPFANRKTLRLSELAQEDLVHGPLSHWEHFFSYLIPLCRKAGFEPRFVHEGLNTTAILGLVACGMGITILTEYVRDSVPSDLVVIPFQDVRDELETVAIWKTDVTNDARSRFQAFLAEWTESATDQQAASAAV